MKALPIIMILVFLFSSCKREDDFQTDSDTRSAIDHAFAERSFAEVALMADKAESGYLGNFREVNDTIFIGCGTIIRDTTANPKTITVDFGTVNCLCQDGRNRRGKIISSYVGNYRDSGTVITHNTLDFYINDNKINASVTVTNKGLNTDNHSWYSVVTSGSIEKAAGGVITWSSSRVREWIEGELTVAGNWQDDVYSVTGTANGYSSNGISFSSLITVPLRMELSCRFISVGKVEFSPANRPIRFIDFGSGTCDNLAAVNINGNIYNISLQ